MKGKTPMISKRIYKMLKMMPKRTYMVYKQKAVCFRCRVVLKDITECPHCRQPMIQFRGNIEVPRRHQVHAWKKLAQKYPWRISHPDECRVAHTHSAEAEYEIERNLKEWRPYREVVFSRKLTPRKKPAR